MSKRILYLECYSGISGDMTVASLLDLGGDREVMLEGLKSLNVSGYSIEIGRTKKCGIDACDFNVVLEQEHHCHEHDHGDHHDHETEHSHVHTHEHSHECHHDHEHDHDHGHNHEHETAHGHCHSHEHEHRHNEEADESHDHHNEQHNHSHEHRNINDIIKIIDGSKISEKAKAISKRIFEVVAEAEAKAHGIHAAEVHFHEVGAVDSIVDIVAAAILIDNLNIDEVAVSELYEGKGHVKCQHGIIPVPVPAVVNIAAAHSLTLKITEARGEMITPTGAAIAAALKTIDCIPSSCIIRNTGTGAGKKDFAKANVLRAYIVEEQTSSEQSSRDNNACHKNKHMWVLETNIDDSTGENLSFTMEKLLENGASDVFFTPIYMKKSRPAHRLTVICKEDDIKKMESVIFNNTTTIGIRRYRTERTVLHREIIEITTKYGPVRVKVSSFEDKKFYKPEYEDIKNICSITGKSFKEVSDEIRSVAVIN
ncbi:MAG: nickel pincer cofactor biosynthesis protein LarC [Sedimentibacter sp.]|uniref:nickel pincer cofactor biosynthesis protein LarC n=1 Tax=Sedimentibacter sp. TaxID=1960295 RepID=UPI003158343C